MYIPQASGFFFAFLTNELACLSTVKSVHYETFQKRRPESEMCTLYSL